MSPEATQSQPADRTTSYGQDSKPGLVDRFGVWLSARQIERYVKSVSQKRVADLGCGYNATLIRRWLSQVQSALLVDVTLAADLKANARVCAIEGSLPGALASVSNASIDILVCNSVIEHVWDPLVFLREIRRLLAPGGVALLNVPSWRGKRYLEFSAFRLGLSPALEMDDHKTYYDVRDLWPLLVRAGFQPHNIRCFPAQVRLECFCGLPHRPMLNSVPSTHTGARSWPWLAGLLSIGAAALWLAHGWLSAPVITNDGIQYLDTASSIASDGCFCAHMAHFDEQLRIGHLPVPMTHYSPGYPLLIATVSRFGLTGESAGYLISIIGFLVTICLMWDLARTLGSRPLLAFVFVLPWIAHRDALVYASAVAGESFFAAVLIGMVALMVRDLKTDGARPVLLAGIGGLAGAAYFLRYAGLSVIPPALLYLLWRFLRTRDARPWALAGLGAAGVFVLPIQIRNIVYTGSWRGIPGADAPRSLLSAVITHTVSLYHLVLGDFHPVPIGIWVGICALSIPGALLLALRAWERGAWSRRLEFAPVALAWIGLIGIVYTAGTIVATIGNANMDLVPVNLVRYYVPLYPILLSGIAGAVSLISFPALQVTAGTLALVVAALHGVNFKAHPDPQEHVVMAGKLQKEVAPGQSLRRWLLDHVPGKQVIVGEEGQVLSYLLHLATVTPMEPPESSNLPYDGAMFFSLMSRYKSRYLLLFPAMRPAEFRRPFLNGLVEGTLPDWLKLRVRTSDVAIFECGECANSNAEFSFKEEK